MKHKYLSFCLLFLIFLLPINTAYSSNALFVHLQNSTEQSMLDNTQSLVFTDNDLSINFVDNDLAVYTLGDIAKITFGDVIITDVVETCHTASLPDVVVYSTSSGEIIVESPAAIQSLTLIGLDGKILYKTVSTTIFIGTLPAGVYLLQINTAQAAVIKKIIKQ